MRRIEGSICTENPAFPPLSGKKSVPSVGVAVAPVVCIKNPLENLQLDAAISPDFLSDEAVLHKTVGTPFISEDPPHPLQQQPLISEEPPQQQKNLINVQCYLAWAVGNAEILSKHAEHTENMLPGSARLQSNEENKTNGHISNERSRVIKAFTTAGAALQVSFTASIQVQDKFSPEQQKINFTYHRRARDILEREFNKILLTYDSVPSSESASSSIPLSGRLIKDIAPEYRDVTDSKFFSQTNIPLQILPESQAEKSVTISSHPLDTDISSDVSAMRAGEDFEYIDWSDYKLDEAIDAFHSLIVDIKRITEPDSTKENIDNTVSAGAFTVMRILLSVISGGIGLLISAALTVLSTIMDVVRHKKREEFKADIEYLQRIEKIIHTLIDSLEGEGIDMNSATIGKIQNTVGQTESRLTQELLSSKKEVTDQLKTVNDNNNQSIASLAVFTGATIKENSSAIMDKVDHLQNTIEAIAKNITQGGYRGAAGSANTSQNWNRKSSIASISSIMSTSPEPPLIIGESVDALLSPLLLPQQNVEVAALGQKFDLLAEENKFLREELTKNNEKVSELQGMMKEMLSLMQHQNQSKNANNLPA